MAFGFGFNKQKVLSAAEKFVQQGKLQNAIAEYDKVLKHDEKDLTVNNTIGDLYARSGDSAKAIECFKKVGDAYAAQGFTVKGIAMYKKISKLQPSVDSSLKLAELYTQQGLFNDARAQYLQVAKDFMKNGDLEQAVRLFLKVLEMDPENVPIRVELAELYLRLAKKKEAWEIFSAVAEGLRSRGSLAAAEDILKRMLALDPGNSYVLLLRGKSTLESGDPKGAIAFLEKASDLDSHAEGLRDLLQAYLQVGNLTKAAPIAEKLFTVHNDAEGLFLLAEGCARLGQYHEALEVYTRHADRLLATDSAKMLGNLHTMIARVRDDSGALDTLLLLLNKAGESTHVNEVTELLAHASAEDGNLTRARDLYQMLATTEPQNALHTQNYQQMVTRLAEASPAAISITAEEGAVLIEELEATAPVVDQSYPDAVAIAVRSAVTDADLFLSYNLPDKAVVPLLNALPQAPCDARLNQRLAALHTRFHRFTEAAVCCRTLESVYHDAGYPDEAVRYGELAARYEQSAEVAPQPSGSLPTALSSASSPVPVPPNMVPPAMLPPNMVPPAASVTARPAAGPAAVVPAWPSAAPADAHELPSEPSADLASEWQDSLTLSVDDDGHNNDGHNNNDDRHAPSMSAAVEADAAGNPEVAETVEEIHFYIEHFMSDQARAAMEKLETLTSDRAILDPLHAALASAQPAPDEPEPEIAEIDADELTDEPAGEPADQPMGFEISLPGLHGSSITAAPGLMSGYHHESPHPATDEAASKTRHDAAPELPHPQPPGSEPDPVEAAPAAAGELPSLVAELEASLGDSFPVAPPPATTLSPAAPSPIASSLPGWPAPSAPKRAAEAPTNEVEPELAGLNPPLQVSAATPSALTLPVASNEIGTSAASTAEPSIQAQQSAAAAAASASTASSLATSGPKMSYAPAPVRPLGTEAQAVSPSNSVDLSEMFGALKLELEEDGELGPGDEDPETHYNLGVAFREMGLLDEAIAEFQKVCTAIDRGKAFSQPVQTYTWLAQCFLDKGVPEAAIRWYEKALNLPQLDDEGRLAINYELGSACESAQDKSSALRHFTAVYSANIDYRDVAERIQGLKS